MNIIKSKNKSGMTQELLESYLHILLNGSHEDIFVPNSYTEEYIKHHVQCDQKIRKKSKSDEEKSPKEESAKFNLGKSNIF